MRISAMRREAADEELRDIIRNSFSDSPEGIWITFAVPRIPSP